jgi:hypothetical protein
MKTVSKVLVAAAALFLLAGCAKQGSEAVNVEVLDADASLTADLLRKAPTEAEVGGVKVTLETTVSRKFVGENGEGLVAQFTLKTTDGAALPAGVTIAEAWLATPTWLWETDVTSAALPDGSSDRIAASAFSGPKWEVNTPVESVVRIKDATGVAQLVRQSNVVISKVE